MLRKFVKRMHSEYDQPVSNASCEQMICVSFYLSWVYKLDHLKCNISQSTISETATEKFKRKKFSVMNISPLFVHLIS